MEFFNEKFSSPLYQDQEEPEQIDDEEDRKYKDVPIIQLIKRVPTKNPTKANIAKREARTQKKPKEPDQVQPTDYLDMLGLNLSPKSDTPTQDSLEDENKEQEDDDVKQSIPGITIVNGELVLDSSQYAENEDMLYQRAIRANKYSQELKSQNLTSGAFIKREKTLKWTEDETEQFYSAIRLFGTDFMLIHSVLPGRSITQIKRKFKLEESKHPAKIRRLLDAALHQADVDSNLKQLNEVLEAVKREKEEKAKETAFLEEAAKQAEEEAAREHAALAEAAAAAAQAVAEAGQTQPAEGDSSSSSSSSDSSSSSTTTTSSSTPLSSAAAPPRPLASDSKKWTILADDNGDESEGAKGGAEANAKGSSADGKKAKRVQRIIKADDDEEEEGGGGGEEGEGGEGGGGGGGGGGQGPLTLRTQSILDLKPRATLSAKQDKAAEQPSSPPPLPLSGWSNPLFDDSPSAFG